MALRGANIDDMDYVETFGLDPSVAYSPAINEVMLQKTYEENIQAGIPEEQAAMTRATHAKAIAKLMK